MNISKTIILLLFALLCLFATNVEAQRGNGNGNGNSGNNGNNGNGGNSGNSGNNGNGGGNSQQPEEPDEVIDSTCNRLSRDRDACEAQGCFYCDQQKCRTGEDRCPNASDEGTCNPIQSDQEFCEEVGCFFCEEAQKCRTSEDRCPGNDEDEDEDVSEAPSSSFAPSGSSPPTVSSVPSTSAYPSVSIAPSIELTEGLCNPLSRDRDACEAVGCFYCDKQKCRTGEDRCPLASDEGTCNPVQDDQEFCEEIGCFFCEEAQKCRTSEDRCPGPGQGETSATPSSSASPSVSASPSAFVSPSGTPSVSSSPTVSSSPSVSVIPTLSAAPTSSTMPSSSVAPSLRGGLSEGLCNPIKDQDVCEETGCFYCDKQKCRTSEDRCPPAADEGTCNPVQDQEFCEEIGCFYCEEAQKCRTGEGRCPGSEEDEDEDSSEAPSSSFSPTETPSVSISPTASPTLSLAPTGSSVPSLSAFPTIAETLPPISECSIYTSMGTCVLGSITGCRWCPDEEECTHAGNVCADGTRGIIGNPCKYKFLEGSCGEVEGCLWCEENAKCKKVEDGCEYSEDDSPDDDQSLCGPIIFEIDCTEEPACQWCPDQMNCKANDLECDAPSGSVEIDVDYQTPAFTVHNDGLGAADPNAVTVAIDYLYEVMEDGIPIASTMVDVTSLEFRVTQSEGINMGVLSKKVTFTIAIRAVGTLELVVFLMKEDGTLTTPSGEVYEVSEGDVKFNVNLSDWTFDSGSFIDIGMTIQGSAVSPEEESGSMFNLGGGIPLILSSEVEVDGVIETLPEGFPTLESTEEGEYFVFRFPAFTSTLVYDPIVGSGALKVVTDDDDKVPLTGGSDGDNGLRTGGEPTSGTPDIPVAATVSAAYSRSVAPTLFLLVAYCLGASWF